MPRSVTYRPKRSRLTWRDWTLQIREQPDYLGQDTTHLEVIVLEPKGAPIPITDTGYRSHFIDSDELSARGGAKAFVTAWLDQEARGKAWARIEAKWRQLELELVMPEEPKPKRRSAKPAAKAAKRAPR